MVGEDELSLVSLVAGLWVRHRQVCPPVLELGLGVAGFKGKGRPPPDNCLDAGTVHALADTAICVALVTLNYGSRGSCGCLASCPLKLPMGFCILSLYAHWTGL